MSTWLSSLKSNTHYAMYCIIVIILFDIAVIYGSDHEFSIITDNASYVQIPGQIIPIQDNRVAVLDLKQTVSVQFDLYLNENNRTNTWYGILRMSNGSSDLRYPSFYEHKHGGGKIDVNIRPHTPETKYTPILNYNTWHNIALKFNYTHIVFSLDNSIQNVTKYNNTERPKVGVWISGFWGLLSCDCILRDVHIWTSENNIPPINISTSTNTPSLSPSVHPSNIIPTITDISTVFIITIGSNITNITNVTVTKIEHILTEYFNVLYVNIDYHLQIDIIPNDNYNILKVTVFTTIAGDDIVLNKNSIETQLISGIDNDNIFIDVQVLESTTEIPNTTQNLQLNEQNRLNIIKYIIYCSIFICLCVIVSFISVYYLYKKQKKKRILTTKYIDTSNVIDSNIIQTPTEEIEMNFTNNNETDESEGIKSNESVLIIQETQTTQGLKETNNGHNEGGNKSIAYVDTPLGVKDDEFIVHDSNNVTKGEINTNGLQDDEFVVENEEDMISKGDNKTTKGDDYILEEIDVGVGSNVDTAGYIQ